MDIKEMTAEELIERRAAIANEVDAPEADLNALEEEVRAINAELEERKAAEAQKEEVRKAVAEGAGEVMKKFNNEERKMDKKEERAQLMDALAEYIKGTATEEQRALLTTGVSGGTVKVSNIVDDFIWTDWDKSPILSRIRKVYVKGNYSVGYEASATGAVKHTEGDMENPAEEVLTLGYINFVEQYYKKWITVSDTVLALKGEAFMRYLMDEFGHQLAIALENAVVAEIAASTLSAKVTNPINNTAAMAGFAALSDEAVNPVVIISKTTYAAIMNERATTGGKIEDPFNGMEVLFNRNVAGMLVGDLDGVVANFPDGEDFKFVIDDKSLAEHDMVKIVGKILGDIHLVRPNGFAVVTAA
jgi:HK97 family phage major capsid protein